MNKKGTVSQNTSNCTNLQAWDTVDTGNSLKGHNARTASCIQSSKSYKGMLMQVADVFVWSKDVAQIRLNAANEEAGAVW